MKTTHARAVHANKLSCLSRHRGFSLIETIAALVILGIILLALSLMPIMTTRLMSDTTEREKAVLLAVGKLDEIEGDLTLVPGTETSDLYTMQWTGENTSGNYIVTLTISWNGVTKGQVLTFKRQVSLN